jgi:hypothetical protein
MQTGRRATMPEPEGIDLACRLLLALKPLAERSGNTTLVALTDHVRQTRNAEDLASVFRLYTQEYPNDPLAAKIHVLNSGE